MKNLSRTSKRIIAIAIALSLALTLALDGQMFTTLSYADEAVVESMNDKGGEETLELQSSESDKSDDSSANDETNETDIIEKTDVKIDETNETNTEEVTDESTVTDETNVTGETNQTGETEEIAPEQGAGSQARNDEEEITEETDETNETDEDETNEFIVFVPTSTELCTVCGELETECICEPGATTTAFDIADHLIVDASGVITGFVANGAPKDITIPVKSKGGITITAIGTEAFKSMGLTGVSFESGSQITSIGSQAFRNNPITAITNLPATLKTISTEAFYQTAITSIDLPSGVNSIGTYAFYGCNQLTSIDLSHLSLTTIGVSTFQACSSLSAVTLPATLRTIGNSAFGGASLSYIKIPALVNSIGTNVFTYFKSGGTIDLEDHAPYSISGDPWGATAANITVRWKAIANDSDFVFNASNGQILGLNPAYTGDGNIIIPAAIDGVAVKSLATGAFNGSKLIKRVSFEAGCQITTIPADTFRANTNLTSVTLPEGITSLGNYAFSETRFTAIALPTSLRSIGIYAFSSNTSLRSITLPEGVTTVGGYIFYGCTALTNVTLPESLTSIANFAFYNTSRLTEIRIPAQVQSIASQAFGNTSGLKTVTFEGSAINSIAATAFTTKVEDIYLGQKEKDSIADRPWGAIYAKVHWADVTDTVAIVTDESGEWIFNRISGAISQYLSLIVAGMDLTIPTSLSFGGVDYPITAVGVNNANVVPENSELGRLLISDGITLINNYAFRNVRISELDLGSTVTGIGTAAFNNSNMGSLTLPDGLRTIGSSAFANNALSGEIIIPASITNIGTGAFTGNPGISEFTVLQYRSKESDGDYNKTVAAVINYAPWGVTGTPVYFMDDPRPVYEVELVADMASGSVAIELKTRINLGLNVGAITAAAGMPTLTNVSLAPSGANWSTATMTVTENGTYSFVVTYLGSETYTINVSVDVFPEISTVTGIKDLPATVLAQSHYIGANVSDFDLPTTLTGVYDGGSEVNIPVTWTASPAYAAATAGTYSFSASLGELPDGFELGSGVGVPVITVTLKDSVADLAELTAALATINDSDLAAATLRVSQAIPVASTATLESATPVTLTVAGNWRHFNITSGGNLTLSDGLTLTRAMGYENNGGGVNVNGGSFTMVGGVITNNKNSGNGGGIWMTSATTISISGGRISDNTAVLGGGLYNDSTAANIARIANLKIGAGVVFAGNTSTDTPLDGERRLKETSPLFPYYTENIFATDWSHGFAQGYNGHDIGFDPALFGADDLESKLSVSFALNDGSASMIGSVSLWPGESVGEALPADPIRADFSFLGWNTADDGTGDDFTADSVISETMTVYAIWEMDEIENTPHPENCDCDDCDPAGDDEHDDGCDCADCDPAGDDEHDENCDCDDCADDSDESNGANDDNSGGNDDNSGAEDDEGNDDGKNKGKNTRRKSPVGTDDPSSVTPQITNAGPPESNDTLSRGFRIEDLRNDEENGDTTQIVSPQGRMMQGLPESNDSLSRGSRTGTLRDDGSNRGESLRPGRPQEINISASDVPLTDLNNLLNKNGINLNISPILAWVLAISAAASLCFLILLAKRKKDEEAEKRQRIRQLQARLEDI